MADEANWQELTNLTRGRPFLVERVRLAGSGVAVEGASNIAIHAKVASNHGAILRRDFRTVAEAVRAVAALDGDRR